MDPCVAIKLCNCSVGSHWSISDWPWYIDIKPGASGQEHIKQLSPVTRWSSEEILVKMLLNRHSIIPVSLLCFAVVISASPAISNRPRSVLSVCQVDLNNVTFTLLLDCVRDKSLLYLDRITATDSIDVLGGGAVKLVRRKDQRYHNYRASPN